MKHIRRIFESMTHKEMMDHIDSFLMDLCDKFDYHVHRDYTDRLMYGSNTNGNITISAYDDKIFIEIHRKTPMSKGFYNDLDVFKGFEIHLYFKKISKKIKDFFPEYKYTRCGGSVFHSDANISMIFSKSPFEQEDPSITYYGTDKVIYVPSKRVYLNITKRHDNIINIYDENLNLIIMVSVSGYHGSVGHFYNRPLVNIFGNNGEFKPTTDLERWVYNEWESVCKRLKINNMQKITKFPPKISTTQFMVHLWASASGK